jgi:hypothetical protein
VDEELTMVGRVLWTLFGSVLLVAAVGWGALNMAGVLAHDESVVEYRQSAAGLTTLRVRADGGRVEIRTAGTDEITVVAEVSRGLFATDESARVVGDTFELRSGCSAVGTWCSVDYEITVPGDLALDVVSDDGSIVGIDLTNATVEATAADGRVELAFAAPPDAVVASADDGSVTIAVPDVEGGYAITTAATDGRVSVEVTDDPTSRRTIDASANDGSITISPAL